MKKMRLLAWLLIVAMLAMVCPALGEELEVVLTDEAAVESLPDAGIELEGDAVEPGIFDGTEGDLSLDLPEMDLSASLEGALEGDAAANGEASGRLSGHLQSQGGYDNDALFAGYVDMLFGKRDALGLKPNGYAGDQLSGAVADVYNYLLKQIEKVAAGTLSSTEMTIPSSVLPAASVEKVFYALGDILDALLVDCPYHLFWYDKTRGLYYGVENDVLSVSFTVASEYASGPYTTDAKKIQSAQIAATNAKNVVKRYAGASDYDKLCGYRDYICGAVEYYDDAATDPYMPYGNPWQLIWVLDGDSGTNVVCEGYAKAFQYLCDLSSFSGSIRCLTASGYAQDQGGSGPHMWNIVAMDDGRNYHVDITFIDGGMGEAFLCGASATQYDNVYCVKNEVYYQLDDETLSVYPAKALKLSTSDYQSGNPEQPETPEEPGTYDDAPTGISIAQGGQATLYIGNQLTLKANVTPADSTSPLTWTSSKPAVATVDDRGVVTPKKSGKTTITVATENGLKAKITVKVVDASSVKLKKGNTTLKKGQKIELARGKSLTLKAEVTPAKVKTSLTWKSSNKLVTVKNGKVTVNKKAKAGSKVKITVRTANGKNTYIYIVVK